MARPLVLTGDAMYPKLATSNGFTRHAHACKSTFGRCDPRCHRCLELLHGAAPRSSALSNFAARKLEGIQRRLF